MIKSKVKLRSLSTQMDPHYSDKDLSWRTSSRNTIMNVSLTVQIAEALLEKETLLYKDMEQLIGPPPHGARGVLTDWRSPPSAPMTA